MGEPATVGRWVREARIELRVKFGPADVLPRTGAFASHTLGYELRVPGAPARISLFATAPEPATNVKSVLLRIDAARSLD